MARSLANKTNVDAPDGYYPYGRIRDNDGTGNGTPVSEQVYGDFHQFFEKLMAVAGITANELPDNDYNEFQLYDALSSLIGLKIVSSSDDFNDFEEPGIYSITGNPTNSPVTFSDTSSSGFLVVSKGSGSVSVFQHVVTRRGAMGRIKTTVWQPWTGRYAYELSSGTWDMVSDVTKSFAHSLDSTKILRVTATVVSDAGENSQLDAYTSQAVQGGVSWDSTNIILERLTGGIYDSTDFDGTVFPTNRCKVIVHYQV